MKANGNNKDSMNTIEEFTNKWVYAAQTDNERQDLKAEMKVDILALFSVNGMFTLEQMNEAYLHGVSQNPDSYSGFDLRDLG